jgi:ABC-type transport system involved in cytochrome c biogenesis permease subunit
MTAGICYAAAFVFHLFSFSGMKTNRPAFALVRIGFLVSTFYLAAEAIEHGFFLPVANLSQALAFFAWSLAFVYLVLLVKIQSESFGLILSPILTLLLTGAYFTQTAGEPLAVKPVLLNPYFVMHIISAFFAYASFTLSFAAGILYLMQHRELKMRHAGTFYHRLPSLEELERLIYQPLLWGAPLLIVTVIVGFIWSKAAFGEFWIFDPKTIATAITALLYFVILYLRSVSMLRGRQVAVLSLVAFGLVIFSFVGTRFIGGSHSYFQ